MAAGGSAQAAATGHTLTWDAISGRVYRVELRDDLVTGTWTNTGDAAFTNLVGTGRLVVYTNTAASQFLRVQVQVEP